MGAKSTRNRDREAERLGLNKPWRTAAANAERAHAKQKFYATYSDPEARDRSASAAETFDLIFPDVVAAAAASERRADNLRDYAHAGGKALKAKAELWRSYARTRFPELSKTGQSKTSIAKTIADELRKSKELQERDINPPTAETVRAYIRKL